MRHAALHPSRGGLRRQPAALRQKKPSSSKRRSPMQQLQRSAGNQALGRLLAQGGIQTKLTVNRPGDAHEQEADRVADQVMRMSEPASGAAGTLSPIRPPRIQRMCPDCEEELNRQSEEGKEDEELQRQAMEGEEEEEAQRQAMEGEEKEEEGEVMTKPRASSRPQVSGGLASRIQAMRGGGRPLPGPVRGFFQRGFGRDFGAVRIHTDAAANQAARSLNARAFTLGRDVVFGAGEYSPDSTRGKRLLAHELTHVVQQTGERNDTQPQSAKGSLSASYSGDAPSNKIQRWRIRGDEAVSDRKSDTLWGLAKRASGSGRRWPCIRPVSMQSPKATGSRYPYYIWIGDKFDISNLTATAGTTLRIHLFDASEWRDAGVAGLFYPGIVRSSGDVDIDISTAADEGKTPIRTFLIFGHSGGDSMWGGAVAGFRPADHDPEKPNPTFGQAERGFFPRRCWFTPNASARSVGCNSAAFGNAFARTYLRRGASITTTTASVRPRCRGLANTMGRFFGIPGGCAWYNGLDFATSPAIGATTLEGPFFNVGAFHSGSYWTTIAGRL